ncbi:MAG: NUDIX hydrolase [Bacteriovoracales bacterium]|jgi:ADP-ribose pyrophosphatase
MILKWKKNSEQSIVKASVFEYLKVSQTSLNSGKTGQFDVLKCRNWVNMVALTPNEEVVLVKQYRVGTDEVTLEIPGGVIHTGEDVLVGAKRELEEETGYLAKDWTLLGAVDVNPAFMNNKCYTYLASGCEKLREQNLDPFEEIEVITVPLKKIPQLIREGKISHSLVVAGFYLFNNRI